MSFLKKQNKLAKSLYVIENMKNKMLWSIASLFYSLSQGNQESVEDNLSEIILLSYTLGKRAGISFYSMDRNIEKKAKEYLEEKESLSLDDTAYFLQYFSTYKKK